MMSYENKSAWRYRARAEELRTLADCDRKPETRQMLLNVAADYDQIAASMEAIAEAHIKLNTETAGDGPKWSRTGRRFRAQADQSH